MNDDKACDFCSCRPVVARHQIDTRSIAPWEDRPAKWWYACAACHEDVLKENRFDLEHRAARNVPALADKPIHIAEFMAGDIQAAFWACDAGIWERLETQ